MPTERSADQPSQPMPFTPDGASNLASSTPDRSVALGAHLTLTVAEVSHASAQVRSLASRYGGFVASERLENQSVTFTLRVPADELDEVMNELAAMGTVVERFERAEDLTDQLADLEGRLASQQASAARVRALLDKATTVGDVIAIESELAQREAAVESLRKRLAASAGRVAMANLSVRLTPKPGVTAHWTDGGFFAGLVMGWRAFLTVGGGVLTVLGASLPFLALGMLLVGLPWAGSRAIRRRRPVRTEGTEDRGRREQR